VGLSEEPVLFSKSSVSTSYDPPVHSPLYLALALGVIILTLTHGVSGLIAVLLSSALQYVEWLPPTDAACHFILSLSYSFPYFSLNSRTTGLLDTHIVVETETVPPSQRTPFPWCQQIFVQNHDLAKTAIAMQTLTLALFPP
jgi:hypothetical protein